MRLKQYKMNLRIFGWIYFLLVLNIANAQQVAVIPYPAVVTLSPGEFILKSSAIVCTPPAVMPEAAFLKDELSKLGLKLNIRKSRPSKAAIVLSLLSGGTGDEGYRIRIGSEQVLIEATGSAGIFYGTQTLLQMVREGLKEEKAILPCCEIQDAPRYSWRGYMLDESRHFFGKEKVKQLLDYMASYKLNKFHWHLTDEPGWRIEIKKYPRLVTVGGKGNWSDPDCPDVNYYTQEEIKEIVAYAAARHIEVIPEIDMPGHATAANLAYPQYSGGGTPDHPDFTFNVGKEEVYSFLTDVLREVTELFPSPWLHIGGDEVAYGSEAWKTDPDVQAMMKREGLKTVKEAERYFMLRMADSVRQLGKTLTGWDELLDLGVDRAHSLIYWWRHDRVNQLKKSLAGGYSTILCPRRPLYFDFVQYQGHKWGRVWNGFCPLGDVYAFPDKGMASWNLPAEQLGLIKGIQANLWTERVHNEKRLEFMTFPRLCALAEAAWTKPELKNFDDFCRRMQNAYQRFDEDGIYYFDHRQPERHPEPTGPTRKKKEQPMDFRD